MIKKIWVATWKGEGEHDFGILGTPSEKEETVYGNIAYDILTGAREFEEGTEDFDEAVAELAEKIQGDSKVNGNDYGYPCNYNVETFEMEFEND